MEARKKFNYILQNAMMKESFENGVQTEESSLFFRNHDFHRSNTLPFYRFKHQCSCDETCFPSHAPFAPNRRVPRPSIGGRPTQPTDVQSVPHKSLHKLYTFKLKIKTPQD
ncbi:unnamed protein product [Diamesa serratosioi]